MRRLAWFGLVALGCSAWSGCSEEDGGPYPPLQMLVQCHADAAPGDPEACPDLGVDLRIDLGVEHEADLGVQLDAAPPTD